MLYKIDIPERLEKQFKKIPKAVREHIIDTIESLASDPRPTGCKKLQGIGNLLFTEYE